MFPGPQQRGKARNFHQEVNLFPVHLRLPPPICCSFVTAVFASAFFCRVPNFFTRPHHVAWRGLKQGLIVVVMKVIHNTGTFYSGVPAACALL